MGGPSVQSVVEKDESFRFDLSTKKKDEKKKKQKTSASLVEIALTAPQCGVSKKRVLVHATADFKGSRFVLLETNKLQNNRC